MPYALDSLEAARLGTTPERPAPEKGDARCPSCGWFGPAESAASGICPFCLDATVTEADEAARAAFPDLPW